ncbi:MAG: ribonuclease D, partial [Alphaproteobacteria bacterium]|nr:ribonuclease D [Alphaproteobacteria bacterium]
NNIKKIFHYARFDLAAIYKNMGIMCENIYCTKIASKLVRTYTDKHGLKELCKELVNVDISKQKQSSDWGNNKLSHEQLEYAASDVLYLHKIKYELDIILKRENRNELAEKLFKFIGTRAYLDLNGWNEPDIFDH